MISTTEIQARVAAAHGLTVADMRGPSRARRIAHPRQEAMYLARVITKRSWNQLGRMFGNRDHTTIMHGHRAARERIASDWRATERVWAIARELAEAGR